MKTYSEWMREQKELCERATKPPWAAFCEGKTVAVDIGSTPHGHRPCIVNWPGFDSNNLSMAENHANCRFVAASRLSLPTALKIIEALVTKPDEKLSQIESWRFDTNLSVVERIINEVPHA